MPLYRWTGINHAGTPIRGAIQANTPEELKHDLLAQGIALLDIDQGNPIFYNIQPLFNKIATEHVGDFFQRLSLLLSNGVELVHALEITTPYLNKRLQPIVSTITTNIRQGQHLYTSLTLYPTVFSPFMTHIIASGEQTGKLAQALEQLTIHMQQQTTIKQHLKRAALAPLLTLSIALIMVISIIYFLVPHFESLYQSLNSPIPASTQLLLTISTVLHSWQGLIVVLLGLMLISTSSMLMRIPSIKRFLDKIMLHIPLLKTIIIQHNMILVLQTITIFLESGLSLATALEQAQKTIHNEVFRRELCILINAIFSGKDLSATMQTHTFLLFDKEIAALVHVGEQSGTLTQTLQKVIAQQQKSLSDRLHAITTLLSPVLMIVVGLIIGGIMAMLYMPLFNLGDVMR